MKGKKENKRHNTLENFQRGFVKIQNPEAKDKKSQNTLRQALREAYNELEKRVEERTAYLMVTNKNLQQEINERVRAEGLLHYRIEFEKLIATLSSDFIKLSSDEIPSAIRRSLQTIGEFLDVDCSFVFLFSEDATRIDEIYKWCKKEIRLPLQDLKGCLIADKFPWLLEKIKRHKVFHVSCSDELPSEAWKEKEYFSSLEIQSCIIIPLFLGAFFIGFVGFNSIRTKKIWEVDILELLRIIGEIFVNAIGRKKKELYKGEYQDGIEKRYHESEEEADRPSFDKKITCAGQEKELRDTLKKQVKLKEHILEIAAEGFFVTDAEGNILDASTYILNLLGYSAEEMLSMKIEDIEVQKIPGNFKGNGDRNGIKRLDTLYRRKNGKILPVNISSSPFSYGKDTFFIFSVFDISEDEQAEKEMQFLSNAVDQSTDGIAFVSLDGYFLSANGVFADIHGYNPKELINKHTSIFYPLSLNDYLEAIDSEMKSKGEFKGEVWHARKDKTMFPAAVRKSLILDKTKNPIGYVMIVNDISQKRKLNKSIPEYVDTEKVLINAFTESLILIDKDGIILGLNEKAADGLGKSFDELLNQSLYDFIPPRLALSNKEKIDKAVKSKRPVFSNEGIGKSKVDTSYYPISDENGKVVKVVVICRKMQGYDERKNVLFEQNDDILNIQEMDIDKYSAEQAVEKREKTFKDLFITKHNHIQGECNSCFEGIISRNSKIWELFEILPSIAESVSTVLIQGESGTGKYLFASAIHNLSPRNNKPFITVNCGALPETLLESELFGYKAGAFTDARKDKPGRFALAEGGTLFLDEIGDISPAMQVRLLRFLQERVYEPLGSIKSIKADVRIISATNKDLEILVKEGTFRDDLFYRINVVRLDLPPLRERLDDVPLLIADILDKLNKQNGKKVDGITEEALMCLLSYDYPGNVRELENIIEGATVLCKSGQILPKHLPKHLNSSLDIICTSSPIQKIEAAFLMNVLKQNNWNRVKTARQLGIHKTTLFRKIKSLGIKIPASGKESGPVPTQKTCGFGAGNANCKLQNEK
ncbi:MAG: sigma 54-interacting transcriptional regulator [bacterium]